MSAKLPPSIVQAIDSLRWPLTLEATPPMFFQPLEAMLDVRRQQGALGSGSLAEDVIGLVNLLRVRSCTCVEDENGENPCSAEYMARIGAALLLLGHSFTDEAHNLVSPLSFPKELPFAYGPPTSTEPAVLALASYVHCLVHRREGPHDSEFSMTGFGNSDYWAGAALRSVGEETLPLAEIRSAIMELANRHGLPAQEWVQHSLLQSKIFAEWDPRLLTELCQSVLGKPEHPLHAFCASAAEMELRIVLRYTLSTLGYDCSRLVMDRKAS